MTTLDEKITAWRDLCFRETGMVDIRQVVPPKHASLFLEADGIIRELKAERDALLTEKQRNQEMVDRMRERP